MPIDPSRDRRSSRQVGGTGGTDDADTGSDFSDDQEASRRVGGSGNATDSPDPDPDPDPDPGGGYSPSPDPDPEPAPEPEPSTRTVRAAVNDAVASQRVRSTTTTPEPVVDDALASVRVGGSGDPTAEPEVPDVAVDDARASRRTPDSGARASEATVDAAVDDALASRRVGASGLDTGQVASDGSVGGPRQGPLDRLGEQYTENIAEPFGEAVGGQSVPARIEQAAFGTDNVEEFNTAVATSAAEVGNVPGTLATAGDAIGFAPRAAGLATTAEGRDELVALGRGAAEAGIEQARSDPIGTAGAVGGAVAGGFAGGTAATRGLRGLRSAGSSSGGLRAGSIIDDTRAQGNLGFGRRGRSDTDTREQTTIEETIEEGDTTDTISTDEFVDQRTRTAGSDTADLEAELRQMADEADELEGRQRTPQQRAEQRVPPQDAFASPMAQQREISRLADRFRRQDMSDLDNRVVPQPTTAETSSGLFGGVDVSVGAGFGGASVAGAVDTPTPGGLQAEPTVTPATGGTVPAFGGDLEVDTEGTLGDVSPGGLFGGDVVDGAEPTTEPPATEPTPATGIGDTGTGTAEETGTSIMETTLISESVTIGTQQGTGQSSAAQQDFGVSQLTGAQQASVSDALQGQQATTTTATQDGERTPRRLEFEGEGDDDDLSGARFGVDNALLDSGLASADELLPGR